MTAHPNTLFSYINMQPATSFALSRLFYIDVQHRSGGSDCTSFQCQSRGSIYMLLMKEPHHLNNPAYSNPIVETECIN